MELEKEFSGLVNNEFTGSIHFHQFAKDKMRKLAKEGN
jgi:hypothetical protein